MRYGVLNGYGRVLARGAAVIAIGGLAASCSSSATRFSDGLFTGSTNQSQIIPKPVQPFPGDSDSDSANATVDGSYTGSVASSGGGVQRSALAPVPQAGAARAAADPYPLQRHTLDETTTGGTTKLHKSASSTLAAPADTLHTADGKAGALKKELQPGKAPVPEKAPSKVATLPDSPKRKNADGKVQTAGADSTSPKAKGHSGTYTVAEGDTLNKIARAHGTTAAEIKAANGMSSGAIHIGQALAIPGMAKTTKMASAGIDPIMTGTAGSAAKTVKTAKAGKPAAKSATPEPTLAAYTPPKKASMAIEAVEDDNAVAPGGTGIGKMRWPVRGKVVEGYGASNGGKASDGIDIAVPEGTPVKAAENGVVIYAGNGLKDFGNTVLVRHADGLVTVYGHADALKVSRGDTVKRGQEIATSGMSGAADTPMLHFEVRKNSAAVDPAKFLE